MLRVDIYKSAYSDCTNGGVSGSRDTMLVVNVPGPATAKGAGVALKLVDGPRGTKHLVPVVYDGKDGDGEDTWVEIDIDGFVGPMFGGNYAGTSDSRFGEAVGFYGAVAIHDRFETVAQYEALST